METNVSSKKQKSKCPECSNYIDCEMSEHGILMGYCHVCKSVVSIKQNSPKEKIIRIRKNSNKQ
jgi:hypothetical protein